MTAKKPFEIARETLKQITARKLAPTPINDQAICNEVAGVTFIARRSQMTESTGAHHGKREGNARKGAGHRGRTGQALGQKSRVGRITRTKLL